MRIEQEDRERRERERKEGSQERGEKRMRTDRHTDVESTQSRQKKGSLNSMRNFTIRPTTVSKTSRRRTLGAASSYQKLACPVKKWFDTRRTRYGKLTQTKSGQGAEKSTERQTWLKDSFSFLRSHIRRKGVSKSSAFKHPRDLLQPQPQLQFQIHPETQNLIWKSPLHQMLLIRLRAPVPSDDNLQSRLPPRLQIQS